jgi:hypothetical protein
LVSPTLHMISKLPTQKRYKLNIHIMLRECLTEIRWTRKCLLFLDTPEHVDSENINLKIGHGSYLYQLFSKRNFYFKYVVEIGKKWPKMDFFDFLEKVLFLTIFIVKTSLMCPRPETIQALLPGRRYESNEMVPKIG